MSETHSGRPAVFMDRDGCLIEEVGYLNHPSRVRILPRSAAAVSRLNAAGIPALMATNQAGIARGYFSAETLAEINAEVVRQLEREGARLDGLYVCTHHPTAGSPPYRQLCECRKPKPGLLHRAARELGLDLSRSVMVGDKPSDVEAGQAAGGAGVLVLTGYGRGEWEYLRHAWTVKPDHVAEDLLDAVVWSLARFESEQGVRCSR
ncbi:MAG TPA: HAD family hydrolase [Methylomirabilota bacterium]